MLAISTLPATFISSKPNVSNVTFPDTIRLPEINVSPPTANVFVTFNVLTFPVTTTLPNVKLLIVAPLNVKLPLPTTLPEIKEMLARLAVLARSVLIFARVRTFKDALPPSINKDVLAINPGPSPPILSVSKLERLTNVDVVVNHS